MELFNTVTHRKLDEIMATIAQLTDAVNTINTALGAVGTEISTLKSTIASSVGGADSDALLAQLTTISAGLEALVTPPVTPAG